MSFNLMILLLHPVQQEEIKQERKDRKEDTLSCWDILKLSLTCLLETLFGDTPTLGVVFLSFSRFGDLSILDQPMLEIFQRQITINLT